MENILNKCPICGSKLEYHAYFQFTKVYRILKNGKLSSRPIRNEDDCAMDCGFILCENPDCDFHTNSDLEVENNKEYEIYLSGDASYKIESKKEQGN